MRLIRKLNLPLLAALCALTAFVWVTLTQAGLE